MDAQKPVSPGYFISPMDLPVHLSANFGELRSGHFHSGIDIKTQGRVGKPVYASAEGTISRINVSPVGFGKALYITHPEGFTTVYAHLDAFMPEVEGWVKNEQYLRKSFPVNLFPPAGLFIVGKGEQIGISGNTGTSSGPHLHFEIRDARNQNPLNPLEYLSEIQDDIAPLIQRICLYPLGQTSMVDGRNEKKSFQVQGSRGRYRLTGPDPVPVSGNIGIGVEVIDYLNHSWNKCGIYSMELTLDQELIYSHSLDEFSFAETRYINSHIDYEEKVTRGVNIQKAFLQPNNRMSIYRGVKDRGIIRLSDSLPRTVELRISDVHRNLSILRFRIQKSGQPLTLLAEKRPEPYSAVFPWEENNSYGSEGFKIFIPAKALYDTVLFSYARTPSLPGTCSPLHHVHRETTPVHAFFELWIKPDSFPPGKENKLLVVRQNGKGEWEPFGGKPEDGFIRTRTRDFGRYAIATDTVPPLIDPVNIRPGKNMAGLDQIEIRIKDDLSGIASYHGYIDNRWVLFEYDEKSDLLTHRFDTEKISPGQWHELVLTVIDERENFSVYHARFFW